MSTPTTDQLMEWCREVIAAAWPARQIAIARALLERLEREADRAARYERSHDGLERFEEDMK